MSNSEPHHEPVRLLLLKQGWDPEDTLKGDRFADMLAARGFDVEVVTSFPHHPGNDLFPGWRMRPLHRTIREGVRVTRVAHYPSHDRNPLRRAATYLSFGLSAFLYAVTRRRAAVIYAYHPPLTTALAALAAGWLRRTPVVLDVQDIWPDTLAATGMLSNRRALRAIGTICRRTWRRAAALAVNSPGFARLLAERGVAPDRIEVIYNWVDEAVIDAADAQGRPAEMPDDGTFRVLIAGNMGPAQGMDTIIAAARLLRDRSPSIRLVALGGGLDRDRVAAEAASIETLEVHGPVPMSEVGAWLDAADALLVHLLPDPLFAITVPSRTQAYMAAGRPILMGVEGDAADLVARAECGFAVAPGNAEELASAAEELAALPRSERDAMGARGRAFYDENLSMGAGVDAMAALLRRVARRRAA